MDKIEAESPVVIIGAGPAGLTAAYELTRLGLRPVVLEGADKVGGLSRTEEYNGFHFDMGGHRFFTKSAEVQQIWRALLGDELLHRSRLSRILYDGKFFHYPLKPLDALGGLGVRESTLVLVSYIRWKLFPYRTEETYEQWVTNRFGRRLFRTFFKTYTEKVWGLACSELKSEWAAQRIKHLSLGTAMLSTVRPPKTTIRTLITEFDYPRFGPGMMWRAAQREIERRQGAVHLNREVIRLNRSGTHIDSVVVMRDGKEETITGRAFISSMPLTELVMKLSPPQPDVAALARNLTYRDFLTVGLIVNRANLFPDNWIYVHSPDVHVGRIQNFKNWSPSMVPDQCKTSLGLEYFCREGDALWTMSDDELVALAGQELERTGLARSDEVEDGCVFRVPKAYPVYDSGYSCYLEAVKEFVAGFENLQTIGRNGLHRYNNQDHAMLTGMLAARNLALGEKHDLWSMNADREYQEEIYDTGADTHTARPPTRGPISGWLRGAYGVTTSVLARVLPLPSVLMDRGGRLGSSDPPMILSSPEASELD